MNSLLAKCMYECLTRRTLSESDSSFKLEEEIRSDRNLPVSVKNFLLQLSGAGAQIEATFWQDCSSRLQKISDELAGSEQANRVVSLARFLIVIACCSILAVFAVSNYMAGRSKVALSVQRIPSAQEVQSLHNHGLNAVLYGNYREALTFFTNAAELAHRRKDYLHEGENLTAVADCQSKLNDNEGALRTLDASQNAYRKCANGDGPPFVANELRSEYLFHMGDSKAAIKLLNWNVEQKIQISDKRSLWREYDKLASYYFKTGDLKNANIYLEKSWANMQQRGGLTCYDDYLALNHHINELLAQEKPDLARKRMKLYCAKMKKETFVDPLEQFKSALKDAKGECVRLGLLDEASHIDKLASKVGKTGEIEIDKAKELFMGKLIGRK